jgi:hypothetical protein
MVLTDGEKQSTSITLIGGHSQAEKEEEEVRSCSHRLKRWCTGKYFISIGISIIIIIVMIILILLFREKNRRCGIFYDSQHCQQTHNRSN